MSGFFVGIMDLTKDFFVAHCWHVVYRRKLVGYKPVVTLEIN